MTIGNELNASAHTQENQNNNNEKINKWKKSEIGSVVCIVIEARVRIGLKN